MELRWHHWAVALTLAVLVHGIILARVGWTRTVSPSAARLDQMMVAIEAGHRGDEIADFAAPPAVVGAVTPPESPSRPPAPASVDVATPRSQDAEPAQPVPGVAPNALAAPVAARPQDTELRPAPAASIAPDSGVPLAAARPELAPAGSVTLGPEPAAQTAEPVTALPDVVAIAPGPEAGVKASVALPETTLSADLAPERSPEAGRVDVATLVPSAVVRSEQAQSMAGVAQRAEVEVPGPGESAAPAVVGATIMAETVDLELTPIMAVAEVGAVDTTPTEGPVAEAITPAQSAAPVAEVQAAEYAAPESRAAPPESQAGPIPEVATVAPRDSVTARPAVPRLKPTDAEIRQVVADYAAVLKSWVGRHMSYPVHARLNGIEGTAVVRLVMSRDGHVLSYQLERTSGHLELDQEAIHTIRRASPFPPLPPEMDQIELKLRLPLVFSVKNFEARRTVPPIYLK